MFLAILLVFQTAIPSHAFWTRLRPSRRWTPVGLQETQIVEPVLEPGQVLLPSSESDSTQFDTSGVVCPVVLPPSQTYDKWQLYYYGNSGSWKDGSQGFLPTGWIGLAESDDGIHWTKVVGSSEKGSVLAPSDDPEAWDCVHLGVGDVIRINDEELHMYYFGGSAEMVEGLVGPGVSLPGIRMRIGRAKSQDNGRTWERLGVCLDHDESEGLFASWPRIIRPEDDNEPWQMLYHAFNGSKWRVFGATSTDRGKNWNRKGLLLEGGEDEECFDFRGIGTRAVTPWKGGMLMIYEGVDKSMKHRLGAAFCSDENGDGRWEKMNVDGCSQPGGPVASPGEGAMGSWTSTVVGTPYLVSMPDGSLRLYHCGKDADHGHSIGLLLSGSGDVTLDAWKPVVASR